MDCTVIGRPVIFYGHDKPGSQWIPSNGTEGHLFIDVWCMTCARDKPTSEGKDFDACGPDEVCEELSASFRGEAENWRELDSGDCVCLLWYPAGEPIKHRCSLTADMFEAA